jgi:hypothetical protein
MRCLAQVVTQENADDWLTAASTCKRGELEARVKLSLSKIKGSSGRQVADPPRLDLFRRKDNTLTSENVTSLSRVPVGDNAKRIAAGQAGPQTQDVLALSLNELDPQSFAELIGTVLAGKDPLLVQKVIARVAALCRLRVSFYEMDRTA